MIEKSLEYFKNRLSKPLSDKRREAYQDAVRALEKQILKKPIEHEAKFAPIYECPSCGYIDVYGQEHCDNCGQKLDWSE